MGNNPPKTRGETRMESDTKPTGRNKRTTGPDKKPTGRNKRTTGPSKKTTGSNKRITGPDKKHEDTSKTGINLNGRITANPVVSCRVEGDYGALLFNADTDNTLLINPTGIMVWNFINQSRTVEEIVEYISKSYSNSPDPASVKKDIETFVTDLAPDFIAEV
jgi:hypothetical protein